MNFFDAVILGVIEGISEFLPISSTAHLMLASRLLGLAQTDFAKTFEIAIQLGAIASVVVLYGRVLFTDWEADKRIIVAFVPTGIIGALLYPFIKEVLFESYAISLAALFAGGVFLVVFEYLHSESGQTEKDIAAISYKKAFAIGCFQAISVIPGVSRAAATIIGGLLLGLNRKTIVEFSFLLAVPTMAAATFFDISKNLGSLNEGEVRVLLTGFVTAFAVALASISFLLAFIRTRSFAGFGIYRVVFAALVWFLIF